MASDEDETRVNLLDDLRPRLRQLVIVEQVLGHCHSINVDTKEEIRQKAKSDGDPNAVDMLVNAVTKKPHAPGWFREFVDALIKGGCEYAADYMQDGHLNPEMEAENEYCVRFIAIMSPSLMDMKTNDVCDHCFAEKILTVEDAEIVSTLSG